MEGEVHWKHQEIFGTVCQGCLGLGNHIKKWSKVSAKGKRGLMQKWQSRKSGRQQRKTAAYKQKGFQAIGCSVTKHWKDHCHGGSTGAQTRASWPYSCKQQQSGGHTKQPQCSGKEDDASCKQCGTACCTLNYILAACPKLLGEGRFGWRHIKLLTEIAKLPRP